MWRVVILGLLFGGQAFANGRDPGTSTINFRRGMETEILAGMTFGTAHSKDNGVTWTWMCEDAIGYGGTFDPDYVFSSTGALFATTFSGLKVNRDTCVFTPSTLAPPPPKVKFFSTIAGAPGVLYAATVDSADGKIYKSIDDGVSFPTSVQPAMIGDWWQSLEIAPSNPSIMYLAGYRLKDGNPKVFLLFRSSNAGTTYAPLPVTDIVTKPNSTIEIAGISKTDPNKVYARVLLSDNTLSDALYRSVNGGQNWTKILEKPATLSFIVRKNGDLVAGTQALGSFVSNNNGDTFNPIPNAPHINCLAENSAEEVFACTQNYGTVEMPGDGFGIMKTTNLTTWTGVFKFQDLKEPEVCPAGTVQHDKCDVELWCILCKQLGCTANRLCPGAGDGPPVDGPFLVKPPDGCCQTGSDGIPALLALALVVGMVMLRRRRH